MVKQITKTLDGNEATASVAYGFTEVATIYPITPSSPMAEHVDVWSANGRKNLFGQPVKLVEMQSEAGAIGAAHGASETGSLCSSFTASQGLMLMIPVMHRLSGELKPVVLHIAARTVGTHTMSIFGDHSDVMGCRNTGFAMLCSASVQECADLAGIAHLSAIKGHVPFMHFFDGFRTSHEIQKIRMLPEEEWGKLIDQKALYDFKHNGLNPEHPVMRSTVTNPDMFFQSQEACNIWYDRLPDIVHDYMDKVSELTGRDYKLFNYYGAPDAENVIVAMGSVTGAIQETVDALNKQGKKTGYLQVHLYRPFSLKYFFEALPTTVQCITVMDRTKEAGAVGEPLYEDVCAAISHMSKPVPVLACRYGLSSKDVPPASIHAVYNNMELLQPKHHFTLGINDDVTHLSIPDVPIDIDSTGTINCKFWGFGSDGTVGANKNSIKIIGDNTDMYVQAYFEYDTKKSGGVTKSHLRFGENPIRATYYVKKADFLACHKQVYMDDYDIVDEVKDNGIFLLNCSWDRDELDQRLSNKVKRQLAEKHVRFYTINATKIAEEIGLGSNRTNTVLQAAFFKLAGILPIDDAVKYMKDAIAKTYLAKGEKVVEMNQAAVDRGVSDIVTIDVPEAWKSLPPDPPKPERDVPDFIKTIVDPANAQLGDTIPVSAFVPYADGSYPMGSTQYEKRGIASTVPQWIPENCIQCNRCSLVCPHAAIRPYLATEEEQRKAPADFVTKKANGKGLESYAFRVQVSPLDCYSCGACVNACPAKEKALVMKPLDTQRHENENWKFAQTLNVKHPAIDKFSVKGSQFNKPLLEFSGACAGCAETAYMKILTQLFGHRMIVANATGCTQAWGAAMPSLAYTTDREGFGPAWSNSVFEDNAEFALGMTLSMDQQRDNLRLHSEELLGLTTGKLHNAIQAWLDSIGVHNEGEVTEGISRTYIKDLEDTKLTGKAAELQKYILAHKEHIIKKTIWMYGGDGWAYDIGYGGLDHVLAMNANVNIMLVDTEVYSNTGGQSSKATPMGAVAQFAASGRKFNKKDLGRLMMTYGHIYVAQVALGADPNQMIKAIKEAEAYDGPSIIIAYAPCINHGLKGGMGNAQDEMKRAVACGYWYLYRFNPELKNAGQNPFVLDSKEPKESFRDYLMGETRYAALTRTFPDIADELFNKAEEFAKKKYEIYKGLADK
ncbi:MAG: pyruvate:ferredoxin (flavodoxin) oxidoreductase [Megasphaera sp.]|jgi:pyruvate-ferredoxin/flavodoxin oxidoreductase|nr:pyruvate:ferredoxin (flavodoxin) oxidoreductase [Megasphaera sp.]MCI1248717.1 pyruvate:ferredoxin (flavodoxin) oxidoreductase [Megasphaera sp.]